MFFVEKIGCGGLLDGGDATEDEVLVDYTEEDVKVVSSVVTAAALLCLS